MAHFKKVGVALSVEKARSLWDAVSELEVQTQVVRFAPGKSGVRLNLNSAVWELVHKNQEAQVAKEC